MSEFNQEKKFDAGKIRWDLLPLDEVEDIAAILTYGAQKYSSDSWQTLRPFRARYFAAAMRHLAAWRRGEQLDPESGLPHLSHAGCNLLFLAWGDKHLDSRGTPGEAWDWVAR